MAAPIYKGYQLGPKLRELRKRNGLTLQDLSVRCIQRDAASAPSVSYLSMIETRGYVPDLRVLELLAQVLQREVAWFLDDSATLEQTSRAAPPPGATRIHLEPAFLFSKGILETAIPQLLAHTGVSARQFALLLIRTYQERSRDEFPYLERAAEEVGERAFPLSAKDLLRLARRHGLEIRWYERRPLSVRENGREVRSMVRSIFDPPGIVYVNRAMQSDPARLKFDLAAHIAHKVLHGGDGLKSAHAAMGEFDRSSARAASTDEMARSDMLQAWRDFECTFFAGALLAPKVPFRHFLVREDYRVESGIKLDLTPATVMRRMTKVSSYPYWHFFDAYPPGVLRAVYRGNGIPLPWGSLAQASDPCPHWPAFRMIDGKLSEVESQISVLPRSDRALLYSCHSRRVHDAVGNPHVLSVGIDLAPALDANGIDSGEIVESVFLACHYGQGEARIPKEAKRALEAVAKVLNIAWIQDALRQPARTICPRGLHCPRPERCPEAPPPR